MTNDERKQKILALRSELRELETVSVREEFSDEERKAKLRAQNIQSILTKEIIDVLAPNHIRFNCSDNNLINRRCNDVGSSYGGRPRCIRCYLLDALVTGFDDEHDLVVEVRPSVLWGVRK